MSPTERLVESRPRTLRLDQDQYAELSRLARELVGSSTWWGAESADDEPSSRRVIEIERRGDDTYAVSVKNAVGALGLPGMTLLVEPKVPFPHFSHIARQALSASPRMDRAPLHLAEGGGFVELVASWLVDEAEKLLRDGLARGYREEEDRLSVVRGRANIVPTVSRWLTGHSDVVCTFDEFDADTALNRSILAACRLVSGSPLVGSELKARAVRAARGFLGVSPLQPDDLRAKPDRGELRYVQPFALARQVLSSAGRSLKEGNLSSRSFLFHTPALIEEGLRTILSARLSPIRVQKRGRVLLPSSVSVNPDLELDRPPFTGDVKYKLAGVGWNRGDLAQAVFFAAAYRSPRALIIAFGDEASKPQDELAVGDISVTSALWDVRQGTTPEESEDRLAATVRCFVEAPIAA